MEQKRATLSQVELAYLEAGNPGDPLVVCLHGFPDHAHSYDALLPVLADGGYHAVSPWLRGYAPSGLAPDGCYESARIAADVVELVAALGSDRAKIVGHDWGAVATYAACTLAPERFSRAVAMAVPHASAFAPIFLTNFEQQKRSFYMFIFQLEGLAEGIVSANDLEFIDKLIADWSPGWDRTEQDRDWLREAMGSPENLTAVLSYYRQMINPLNQVQTEEMVRLRNATSGVVPTPTLQLFGADDGCIDPEIVPDQSAFFGGELLVERLAGCGHFLLQDNADLVCERIMDWLGPASAA